MAAYQHNASALSRGFQKEDWEGLVAWDEEIFDPLFQGDISFTGTTDYPGSFTSDYHVPESVASDQNYLPSAPTSVVDGPSSFDYVISAPPSVADGPSSIGNAPSFLSSSPSHSTTAASPALGKSGRTLYESFKTWEDVFPPALERPAESPVLESGEQIFPESFHTANSFPESSSLLLNPFIVGSEHAFNSLDVTASQAFSNVGGWVDQPQIVEPIPEFDHSRPIPIPQPTSSSYSGSYISNSSFRDRSEDHGPVRAITIPQPNRRPTSHSSSLSGSHWGEPIPPILSASPNPRRRPRSTTLPQNTSRPEASIVRRHRNSLTRPSPNSLTTPSPTSSTFGWVSYQPNSQGNRLVPLGMDGTGTRRQRGRVRGLTQEQRTNAALMRVIGACSNCQKRKEKCDPGTPCKSCLDRFKGNLINNPCRDRLLADLTKVFLSDRLGWHPTGRSLESFIRPNKFTILPGISYTIPLNLGFGPLLHVPVHAVQVEDSNALFHNHIIYSWPPSTAKGELHTHAVLPAILAPEAISKLPETLDAHLSLLVTHHFRSFPLYCSPLRILREIYKFYLSLPRNTASSHLLHQSLKLLVLVHIGGDLTLPHPSSDPILAQLIRTTLPDLATTTESTPTPCFIRSQLGAIMPALALPLMKEVLSQLEQLLLNRACNDWPIALAVVITILMTLESIHYHAAKLPYHHAYDATAPPDPISVAKDRKSDEQGIETLFKFYAACFSGCHARLGAEWEGEVTGEKGREGGKSAEDRFVENVREAVKKASVGGYLERRASEEREGEDMGFFFDRLAARLLVLRT